MNRKMINEEPSEEEVETAVYQVLLGKKFVRLRSKIDVAVRRKIIENRINESVKELVESGDVEMTVVDGEEYVGITEKGMSSFKEK